MYIEDPELHLCTFKTPTSWAVMSERSDADCAFKMRNAVKGKPPWEVCPFEIFIGLILDRPTR